MRVSSFHPPKASGGLPPRSAADSGSLPSAAPFAFSPFSAETFARAQARHVPVFLLIGRIPDAASDPSLAMQLAERTVPVRLTSGERPDTELLCRRAGELFSGEGTLPLCALLLPDARPFLAAPLPPQGFPVDPSRLFAWLSHADRRFTQNLAACTGQAAQVLRSFCAPPLQKPYAPRDASHDLLRAIAACEDPLHGGFGRAKEPHPCILQFLLKCEERSARAMFSRAMDAMLSSALYDPLDGGFFRTTLTEDWRVFVPEKPLALNALLAPVLLDSGRRSEAVRVLDFLTDAFPLQGGALRPQLVQPKDALSFSAEQVCAALGSEDGLRACRLLSLLRQRAGADPAVAPSRFSPLPPEKSGRPLSTESPALCPKSPQPVMPEDAAFLRRVTPVLLRARAARMPAPKPSAVVSSHCALAAAVLAHSGRRLGEPRYTQAAQRAVTFLISQPPAGAALLPASVVPAQALHAQPTCGACAALALALLTLGQGNGMDDYAQSGFRLLGSALHAFVRPDGMVMHTPKDPAAFFPRVPAIFDAGLPSPAALLVHALRLADTLRPQTGYRDAIETIWHAAAPAARAQPLSCISLIDAVCS